VVKVAKKVKQKDLEQQFQDALYGLIAAGRASPISGRNRSWRILRQAVREASCLPFQSKCDFAGTDPNGITG
jgi:hypothetical protein